MTAILVDDEADSTSLLALQLQKYCPDVTIAGVYNSPTVALHSIKKLLPDILFLDIEMPEMNGFQLLEKLVPLRFSVVFVTAYNQYAIKAFRCNALDYLVKPVATTDLIDAIAKAKKSNKPNELQMQSLQHQIKGGIIDKIAVSTQDGVHFIKISDIVYTEAQSNYSVFNMENGSQFVISRTLKDVQELLEETHFFRIHRQYIINLNKVKHFDRVDCLLIMENKAELPVARAQKDKLLAKFGGL